MNNKYEKLSRRKRRKLKERENKKKVVEQAKPPLDQLKKYNDARIQSW